MAINLSKRLKKIADYVLPGSSVIDVGTDHGYIPAWLAENNICADIYASDIKAGPLENAVATADGVGVKEKINFLLCDGLDGCQPEKVDTVIVSGMGGETIWLILEKAPWAKEKRLILQPQSKINELRCRLNENGYSVTDASLVSDNGKVYVVWLVEKGGGESLRAVDHFIDPCLVRANDPLLGAYADELIRKSLSMIHGLQRSAQPDIGLINEYSEALEGFKKIREEAKNGDCQ